MSHLISTRANIEMLCRALPGAGAVIDSINTAASWQRGGHLAATVRTTLLQLPWIRIKPEPDNLFFSKPIRLLALLHTVHSLSTYCMNFFDPENSIECAENFEP